jgi:hypothetical protein
MGGENGETVAAMGGHLVGDERERVGAGGGFA